VLGAFGVCAFDGYVSQEEFATVSAMCEEWDVDFDKVAPFLTDDPSSVITCTLRVARHALSANGKLGFLNVCIVAARLDDKLVFSEQILLLTIADALFVPKSVLDSVYFSQTGLQFPSLGDPSNIPYYERRSHTDSGYKKGPGAAESSRISDVEHYLEILGLEPNCTREQIKAAYRKEALKHHPDKHTDDDDTSRRIRHEKFLRIKNAYEQLMVIYA
jgi:DnaJ-domain-containing protein 1